jgi:hypothetical protein
MYYKGTVILTSGVKAILSGAKEAQTTDFGDSFVSFTFETGSEKYKELQVSAPSYHVGLWEFGEFMLICYRVERNVCWCGKVCGRRGGGRGRFGGV